MKEESGNIHAQMESGDTTKVERVNPGLAIWFQTRKALRSAWHYIPEEYIHRLFMFTGMVFMLAARLPDWLSVPPNPIGVMVQMLLMGPVGGIAAGYIYSACLRLAGKWFAADVPSIFSKCTVAWSDLPFAAAWIIFLIVYYLLNAHQAPKYGVEIWAFRDFIGWIPLLAASPMLLWGIVIRVRAIKILFGLDALRAVAVWLITVLMAYVPASAATITYMVLYFVTASGKI